MAAYISFQPSDYFNTKIYTGTGSSNAITGVGFQPDLIWIKNRDAADWQSFGLILLEEPITIYIPMIH